MHRLFVAIEPPEWVKDALVEIMGGVIGARWQDETQLHLTLRFLGERNAREANAIAEALDTVAAAAFSARLEGVGVFDRKGRPDTLWIGVRPVDPVRRLHRKVGRALERIGIGPDTRVFLPHITIARFSRGAGPLDDFMTRCGGFSLAPFEINEFCLYESQLTAEGAVYDIVERYPFAQGALFAQKRLIG